MSRIRRALFLAVPALWMGCSDDAQAPVAGETGGALIFGVGGSSGASAGAGGASSGAGGRTSNGGASNTSGGSPSTGASSSSDGGSSSGNGGAGASSSGGAGTGGAGAPGNGGANPGGSGGGGLTGFPIGALCAFDSNCSPNVCCKMPTCSGPCECQPASNCPASTQFLPCNGAADCAAYGGGKICCRASSGGQTMQYCTKTNGCPGTTLP
jgi:hypothetical protein